MNDDITIEDDRDGRNPLVIILSVIGLIIIISAIWWFIRSRAAKNDLPKLAVSLPTVSLPSVKLPDAPNLALPSVPSLEDTPTIPVPPAPTVVQPVAPAPPLQVTFQAPDPVPPPSPRPAMRPGRVTGTGPEDIGWSRPLAPTVGHSVPLRTASR